MSKRSRVISSLGLTLGALGITIAVVSFGAGPPGPPVATGAASCKGAPGVPRESGPSALAVFDSVTGEVLRTAVVGDATWAVLAGDVVVTNAGDGWLRGIATEPPSEVIWCFRLKEPGDSPGTATVGMVAMGTTVVTTSAGRDVVRLEGASGAVLWTVSMDEPVAGLSVGRSQIYAWTSEQGAGSVVAIRSVDGAIAWRQLVSPCEPAPTLPPPGTPRPPPPKHGCGVPIGPGRVVEAGELATLVSPNDGMVKALETGSGRIRWQFDAGLAGSVSAAGSLVIVRGGAPTTLTVLTAEGQQVFTAPALGHVMAANEDSLFMVAVEVAVEAEGTPPTTALVARGARDGAILWTTQVPEGAAVMEVVGGLLFTSYLKDVAAIRIEDGQLAWRASLDPPARGGKFSVASTWHPLGTTAAGIIAIAETSRPSRD